MSNPFLSIVVPTREGFGEDWLKELLKVKGDVEFILVHPPGLTKYSVEDKRLQQINSSLRGEIIQRITGFFNASGTYVLTINCDEYINPDIVQITTQYFQKFPDSWVMRLSKKEFKFGEKDSLKADWFIFTTFQQLKIAGKSSSDNVSYDRYQSLLEIPIIPLDKNLDILCFFRNRKDHHGAHTENFDKKVWKNEMLQATLPEITQMMAIAGPIKYIPFWCLDRLLGLFIQAKFYEPGKVIGHLLPFPEQIRVEDNPSEHARKERFYILAEILLVRRFPQYGYFWNLIINYLRAIVIMIIKSVMGMS
jgi:glycosyltransferase involved in cell wall biosynthesis